MAIDLSPHQIDAALAAASGGVRQYEWLQSRVAGQNGFEQDPEFRRRFNRFYRVRRGRDWQDKFYALMGRVNKRGVEFRAVLQALLSATNRYEASFASKLVATLDPSKPVIDAFVLRNVGLRLPTYAAADRAGRICEVYGELISAFATFLTGHRGRYLISAFRRTYPDARISNVKMLDFVLWQTRQPRCPSCGGRRVAEILYGLPAFDEELDRNLRAGHIVLGGCCVSDRMPQWRCGKCSHEWV
jgi:hypothetical protein